MYWGWEGAEWADWWCGRGRSIIHEWVDGSEFGSVGRSIRDSVGWLARVLGGGFEISRSSMGGWIGCMGGEGCARMSAPRVELGHEEARLGLVLVAHDEAVGTYMCRRVYKCVVSRRHATRV